MHCNIRIGFKIKNDNFRINFGYFPTNKLFKLKSEKYISTLGFTKTKHVIYKIDFLFIGFWFHKDTQISKEV